MTKVDVPADRLVAQGTKNEGRRLMRPPSLNYSLS